MADHPGATDARAACCMLTAPCVVPRAGPNLSASRLVGVLQTARFHTTTAAPGGDGPFGSVRRFFTILVLPAICSQLC